MTLKPTKSREKPQPLLVRAKITKVKFPERCPVCLGEPEDLVSITVMESSHFDPSDDSSISSWGDGKDKVETTLAAAQGAATFWVPTCGIHGSRSLRSAPKRFVAWAAFFVLFYPGLYFALGIVNALHNPRPLLEPLLGLVVTASLLIVLAFWGYFPRAIERTLRIVRIDRHEDAVYMDIRNKEYGKLFLELNAAQADIVDKKGQPKPADKVQR
ncbi:MAG: hypothetical protein C4K49_08520 [Candidatus Thorarchaeota archaeon]|nr:MAG: hypothetical protein C4K49_08520 [Candidatus Thorarchaeota archaeon]